MQINFDILHLGAQRLAVSGHEVLVCTTRDPIETRPLPEELKTARWMVREREAFIAQTNEQAAEIMRRAKETGARMVSETQVMTEAVEEANILVRNAEEEARVIRLESEDVAESSYEHIETLLVNLLERVRDRRAELHQARPAPPEVPISE